MSFIINFSKKKIIVCVVSLIQVVFFLSITSNVFALNDKVEIYTQLGHSSFIGNLAVSSNGKYFITGSNDGKIKIWDSDSGRLLKTISAHHADISSLAISSDCQYAISVCYTINEVKIWNALTGDLIKTFYEAITSITLTPDDRYLISGSYDGTIKLRDVVTGKIIRTLSGHKKAVASITVTVDGRFIVSGSDDNTVKLWDISTGKLIRTFSGHSAGITRVAITKDGRYALSGSFDKTVKVWELATGRLITTFSGHSDYIRSISIHNDGQHVVSVGNENILKVWSLLDGSELNSYKGITSAIVLPDQFVLAVYKNNTIAVFDVLSGQVTNKIVSFTPSVTHVVAFHTGNNIIVGDSEGVLTEWEIAGGCVNKRYLKHNDKVSSMAISNDDRYIASVSDDKSVKVWDKSTGKLLNAFTGYNTVLQSVAITPDRKYLLCGGHEKLFIQQFPDGLLVSRIGGKFGWVNSIHVTSDSRYAVLGCSDSKIRVCSLPDGEIIKTINVPDSYGMTIAITPDEKYVISGGSALRLWDLSNGRLIRTFTGHKGRVTDVTVTHNGKYIVSGGEDFTVKKWDLSTGRLVMTCSGHQGTVRSVAVTSDDRYLVSGSEDGTVKIWNLADGKELATFVNFLGGEWVAITPEGFFNSSQHGGQYLNVRMGKNVYSIDNFFEKFFNPLYVVKRLQGASVDTMNTIKKGFMLPPEVKIVSPQQNTTFDSEIINVTVMARDTGGGIDEIKLYHNGKAIGNEKRGLKAIGKTDTIVKEYAITLVDGINILKAVGYSKDRTESKPYEVTVHLNAPAKTIALYVIAVGINNYKNPALNLNFAVPDAQSIVNFFKKKGGSLFKKVEIIELYNEQANKNNIVAKLRELQNTNPQDAVIIYLAGHGDTRNDVWYFIPYELTFPERDEELQNKGISSHLLSEIITNIGAKKVLVLIDACKSGGLLMAFRGFEDRKALSQLSRSTGTHIVAASTKDQLAAEVKELGHGVFTYVVLEGLEGKAIGDSQTVTVRKLLGYIEERLPEITQRYKQEAQFPVVDSRGMDFPLILVK